jgi:hypothetical protein
MPVIDPAQSPDAQGTITSTLPARSKIFIDRKYAPTTVCSFAFKSSIGTKVPAIYYLGNNYNQIIQNSFLVVFWYMTLAPTP